MDTFVTFFVFGFCDNKGKIWYFLTTHPDPGNLIIRKMSSHFADSMMNNMDDDSVNLFQTQLGSSDWEKKFEEGWCSDSKYDIYIEITNIINEKKILRHNIVEINL